MTDFMESLILFRFIKNFAPFVFFFVRLSTTNASEMFKTPGLEIKSYVLTTGSQTRDKLNMQNPLYYNPDQNPQFGYDVNLAAVAGDFYGYTETIQTIVIASAPGNPTIDVTDPGFVEWQQLDTQSSLQEGSTVITLAPDMKNYHAHAMFGSSVTVAPTIIDSQNVFVQNKLYTGAPNVANCDQLYPKYEKESVSMDSFGKVAVTNPLYSSKKKIWTQTDSVFEIEMDSACYTAAAGTFKKDNTNQSKVLGTTQANRNLLGFSGHLSKDGHHLLFGAPMFKTQAGYVNILYRENQETEKFIHYLKTPDIKMFFLCDPEVLKKYEGYDGSGKEEVFLNSFACDPDMTLGYSLTSLQIGQGNVFMATGGPRAYALKGLIKIFKFNRNEKLVANSFTFINPVIGEEFNSGFGTTIVGADLDGDGVDELVVGEPYRADDLTDTYNSGVVSIYKYSKAANQYSLKYVLKSPKPAQSNMFGFKVACLGDMDADGREDILIAALKEQHSYGTGKVYLYSGLLLSSIYSDPSRLKEIPEPLQEITSQSFGSELFGFSIGSSRVDLDLNGFSDLVVGDPGKGAQNAHVFFANTYIRFIHADTISKRVLFQQFGIDPDCPEQYHKYKFCQKVNFTLENRGINRTDPLWPDRPPEPEKWVFRKKFNVRVWFKKQYVDDVKNKLINVGDETRLYNFGPDIDNQTAYFFVYGDIPEFFGVKIFVYANTKLESSDEIVLRERYKSDTVLASVISQPIDLSIGPLADVNMKVTPESQTVILDQLKKNATVEINVATKSGREESFVDGVLAINLGESGLILINANSDPVSLVSCRQQGQLVQCKFKDGKYFILAKITINLSVEKLAKGLKRQNEFTLEYSLNWANRKLVGEETFATKFQLDYKAELSVKGNEPSVLEKNRFNTKSFPKLDFVIDVKNLGPSEIARTEVSFYAPSDDKKFSVDGCNATTKTGESKKCSETKCRQYLCSFNKFASYANDKALLYVYFLDKDIWDNVVTEKTQFWITVEYEVTKEASYETYVKENKFPKNSQGSLTLFTKIIKVKHEFPWWIVIVSLAGSITFLAIIILVLVQSGFLKKKNPDLIRIDQIEDDEVIDDEVEMTLNKHNSIDEFD